MKNILKNKKGMTLVEVIVASLIMVIVIGISGTILVSTTNFFSSSESKIRDQEIAADFVKIISDELRFASEITVYENLSVAPSVNEDQGFFYAVSDAESTAPEEKGIIINKKPGDDEIIDIFRTRSQDGREIAIRLQCVEADQPKAVKVFVDVYNAKGQKVFTDKITVQTPNIRKDANPKKVDSNEPKNPMIIVYEFPKEEDVPVVPPQRFEDASKFPLGSEERTFTIKENARLLARLFKASISEQISAQGLPPNAVAWNRSTFDPATNYPGSRLFDADGKMLKEAIDIDVSDIKAEIEKIILNVTTKEPIALTTGYVKCHFYPNQVPNTTVSTYNLVPYAIEFKQMELTGATNVWYTYFIDDDELVAGQFAALMQDRE